MVGVVAEYTKQATRCGLKARTTAQKSATRATPLFILDWVIMKYMVRKNGSGMIRNRKDG